VRGLLFTTTALLNLQMHRSSTKQVVEGHGIVVFEEHALKMLM